MGGWEWGGTVDVGGEVTQERTTDADREKTAAKKEANIIKCRQKQG